MFEAQVLHGNCELFDLARQNVNVVARAIPVDGRPAKLRLVFAARARANANSSIHCFTVTQIVSVDDDVFERKARTGDGAHPHALRPLDRNVGDNPGYLSSEL